MLVKSFKFPCPGVTDFIRHMWAHRIYIPPTPKQFWPLHGPTKPNTRSSHCHCLLLPIPLVSNCSTWMWGERLGMSRACKLYREEGSHIYEGLEQVFSMAAPLFLALMISRSLEVIEVLNIDLESMKRNSTCRFWMLVWNFQIFP